MNVEEVTALITFFGPPSVPVLLTVLCGAPPGADRVTFIHVAWIVAGLIEAFIGVLFLEWQASAAALAGVLLAVVSWWWFRRRRQRAPRAYGARAKARIRSMVRTMRERARPAPGLKPVPQPG